MSVHILKSEEFCVNHLLLKPVKTSFFFFWSKKYAFVSVMWNQLFLYCCIDVIVFKCSVSSLQYEIH